MSDYIPFAQRMGITPAPQVGLREVPAPLRTALWNSFQHWIFSDDVPGQGHREIARFVYMHIGWPADEVHYQRYDNLERLKKWFFKTDWNNVYGFVEWLPRLIAMGGPDEFGRRTRIAAFSKQYTDDLAATLKREGSPYRLSGGQLIPITDESEIAEVSKAAQSPYEGARNHIAQATRLFSMRPEPDYRNCIKESVSAIESVLMEATGMDNAKMPALLAEFDRRYSTNFHSAFKGAVSALYGWTSDESGLRHAIFGEVNVDHADARFMLVTCSAFVNFLVQHTT